MKFKGKEIQISYVKFRQKETDSNIQEWTGTDRNRQEQIGTDRIDWNRRNREKETGTERKRQE